MAPKLFDEFTFLEQAMDRLFERPVVKKNLQLFWNWRSKQQASGLFPAADDGRRPNGRRGGFFVA
ncbi:hypothetical protein [uncultured Rhodoblastus sp.]|uniref:hypothetical protein n=1 Tax=uncultured Rhodoblastus sp. TaxID=543037 RepID=UPI0025F9E9FA|nr:hypothetical protein [uncultured Rhodoblastus sp.]